MTKKHFIQLADTLRLEIKPNLDGDAFDLVVRELAAFCRSCNGAFNRERWIGYIYGKNGPSGGAIKVAAQGASR
jgi:hypothetical protein